MDTLSPTNAQHTAQPLERGPSMPGPTLMTASAVPSIGAGALPGAPDPSGWAGGVNRRRHGRVKCPGVRSSLGEVLDVSASGCKIESRGRLAARVGEVVRIRIRPLTSEPFEAYARVVWFRKVGLFRVHTGLCFEHITPEVRGGLASIASTAVMHDGVWNG
ncbi:MAG: PilZ domain-containing protein [Phycisphaerales bacterium]